MKLILYNWKIRDEWFKLCEQISNDELLSERIGGAGSILYTLFHIVDVEYSWIRVIHDKPDIQVKSENFKSLQRVKELSDSLRTEIELYLHSWKNDCENNEIVNVPWMNESYTKGEIMRHVIAHEIHHMGQLSIWVRELGHKPVSANFIGLGLS